MHQEEDVRIVSGRFQYTTVVVYFVQLVINVVIYEGAVVTYQALPKHVMQSSMRDGNEADRILNESPNRDGKLGDVLERSSASTSIPLLPPTPARPELLFSVEGVDDTVTPDDILDVLHSEFCVKRERMNLKDKMTQVELFSVQVCFSRHKQVASAWKKETKNSIG